MDDTLHVVLELRVLGGLQAGAALPLHETLQVGAGDDDDLLLLDAGLSAGHLRIGLDADGRPILAAASGDVFDAAGQPLPEGAVVGPDQLFRAAGVWLAVQDLSAPWPTPDALQALAGRPGAAPVEAIVADADARAAGDALTAGHEASPGGDDPGRWPEAMLALADEQPWRPDAATTSTGDAQRRMRRWVWGLGGVSLLVGVGLLAWQLDVAPMGEARAQETPTPAARDLRPAAGRGDAGAEAAPPLGAPRAAPEAVDGARAGANASASASADAVRMEVGPTGAPEAGISAAAALPFVIVEVLYGPSSWVRLADGRQLAVGERADGYRLVEVKPGLLVFDGPRRLQVTW